MTVSAKCYYALRAIYALAEYRGSAPMKANEIAERQHIPIKFLEAILSQLKGGGFVNSRRGAEGGYLLAKQPEDVTIGSVIRFIDGPVAPVDCVSQSRPKTCEYPGQCPFVGFWGRVRQAIADVVDETTFADLVKENQDLGFLYVADWTI
ncbi:RrF2 family transcriptional regulator [Paludisphaera mucosa]|uniref:Rrf2 family transcriptional regulator n=1 Tax=Paludisphaera mucosa TaxID=3030827 RepID=A0ABT6FFH7_9BACT|nr:Rrf2 family transcriptional regulator [Paludisphaera mucosa]MDG3006145.1 Rrf2 family transcriptional regulator [Paludisphaera mucosa]